MSRLAIVAETGPVFRDFGPYVPAIVDGAVVFQAATDGGTGVYRGADGAVEPVSESAWKVRSHPVVDEAGRTCFYADDPDGHGALVRVGAGFEVVADTARAIAAIGPLGPTVNASGDIAFRADLRTGYAAVLLARTGGSRVIADTRRFAAFQGLPVALEHGGVLFRADRHDGGQGVYVGDGEGVRAVVETGDRLVALGRFPAADADGTVAFAGTLRGGREGAFAVRGGRLEAVADTSDGFVAFRGAIVGGGRVVFFATPEGGTLGVYAGSDPVRDRIVGLGDGVFGSVVTDLALNPVSIDARGDVAIRLGLADGRGIVVRALD